MTVVAERERRSTTRAYRLESNVVWLLVVATLYPLCKWVRAIKGRRQDWWLSYLLGPARIRVQRFTGSDEPT